MLIQREESCLIVDLQGNWPIQWQPQDAGPNLCFKGQVAVDGGSSHICKSHSHQHDMTMPAMQGTNAELMLLERALSKGKDAAIPVLADCSVQAMAPVELPSRYTANPVHISQKPLTPMGLRPSHR